ncbi:MAG: hypothetical protein ACK5JU_00640 [Bacteroidales bacterium]
MTINREFCSSPTFTDISDWQVREYLQTGGSRSKCWAVNPLTGRLCFFKESHHNYKSEFWMEIIASKVGQSLNLKMLDYNIARKGTLIGCISNNMVESDQELAELMKFLTGCDPNYIPDENHEQYTISFLKRALEYYNLGHHLESFIQVIVFDSIIGNQDRHQENWGFILPSNLSISVKKHPKGICHLLKLFGFRLSDLTRLQRQIELNDIWSKAKFSPIYDSGSCLGREIKEEKIIQLLNNSTLLNSYINRCKAEIRLLNGNKIGYYELLKSLLKDEKYQNITNEQIKKISNNFNENNINKIVMNIDNKLPPEILSNKLTEKRKEFVVKLLTLRLEKLCRLLYEV